MFPQRHSLRDNNGLEQMLQQLPYAPMPLPTPIMDRSTTSTRWKPNNIEVAPNCPRCASTNTKFCYYNNYSLSQPRYFCKGCRRYWTKGGSLRNVPVGGGCRKNRRGRAARHSHQSESPSMMNNNISGNNSGPDDGDSSACNGDQASNEANGSRDIDMALVFAKFLNQNPSTGGEEHGSSSSNNLSTSLTTPDSAETENDAVVQPHKGFDPVIFADSDADAMGLLCGVPLEGTIESFGGEELSLSGIELEGFDVGVVGSDEDVVQDVVWSHDDAIMWQPPPPPMMQMQLQEMEYSMAPLNEYGHELLPISSSMNLASDSWSTSWSSFDLSTMEVFSSRP